mmetsp:Transcript_19438/g.23941  ORF Transcript_19438/g.23941 Transcript_19438/m.23941 type:complete len:392 (-) Transcript_19438:1796-2971(-)
MSDEDQQSPRASSDAAPAPTESSNGHLYDDSSNNENKDNTMNGDENTSNGGDKGDELKLYIGNIDYSTDDKRLRDTFSKYGDITDAFCPMDRANNRPRGFGFVTFARSDDAMKAISEMDNTELDGRTIRVSESRPKEVGGRGSAGGGFSANNSSGEFNSSGAVEVKLFVGNLSFDTEVSTIRELFEKYGEVKDCYMPKSRDNHEKRGFAFVTMPAMDAKECMSKLQGEEVDGRPLRIEESMPRRSDSGGGRGGRGGGGPPMGGHGYGGMDRYPYRGGGPVGYPPAAPYAGGMGRYEDRGAYGYGNPPPSSSNMPVGRDRYDDRDYSRGKDRYDDRDRDYSSSRGRDRYDDDRKDYSSSRDERSRYDDKGDRRDRDRYRSSDRDRDRSRDRY